MRLPLRCLGRHQHNIHTPSSRRRPSTASFTWNLLARYRPQTHIGWLYRRYHRLSVMGRRRTSGYASPIPPRLAATATAPLHDLALGFGLDRQPVPPVDGLSANHRVIAQQVAHIQIPAQERLRARQVRKAALDAHPAPPRLPTRAACQRHRLQQRDRLLGLGASIAAVDHDHLAGPPLSERALRKAARISWACPSHICGCGKNRSAAGPAALGSCPARACAFCRRLAPAAALPSWSWFRGKTARSTIASSRPAHQAANRRIKHRAAHPARLSDSRPYLSKATTSYAFLPRLSPGRPSGGAVTASRPSHPMAAPA